MCIKKVCFAQRCGCMDSIDQMWFAGCCSIKSEGEIVNGMQMGNLLLSDIDSLVRNMVVSKVFADVG
jgi:hypothetical protein